MTTQTEVPLLSKRVIAAASDGTYERIPTRRRLKIFRDRIEIDHLKIHYRYLSDACVLGSVLQISYVTADGKNNEQYFAADAILPASGRAALLEITTKITAARAEAGIPAAVDSPKGVAADAVPRRDLAQRPELLTPEGGMYRVLVYSALVAFPPSCPACNRPVATVGLLRVSGGLRQKGYWFLPVCEEHRKDIKSFISIPSWGAGASRIEFRFANGDYAKQFLTVNERANAEEMRRKAESSPLWLEMKRGLRFVQYQYAFSVLLISFLIASDPCAVRMSQSRVLRGLGYTFFSLLFGWWGIPAGPVFTLMAVFRNLRGGADVTNAVAAALSGVPSAAGGYR